MSLCYPVLNAPCNRTIALTFKNFVRISQSIEIWVKPSYAPQHHPVLNTTMQKDIRSDFQEFYENFSF